MKATVCVEIEMEIGNDNQLSEVKTILSAINWNSRDLVSKPNILIEQLEDLDIIGEIDDSEIGYGCGSIE